MVQFADQCQWLIRTRPQQVQHIVSSQRQESISTISSAATAPKMHSRLRLVRVPTFWRKKRFNMNKLGRRQKNWNKAPNLLLLFAHSSRAAFHLANTCTVGGTSSWTRERQFGHRYLCHFWTEMAEIWSPATFFQDVFAYKISALYHLYFQRYKAFSGGI